MIEFACHGMLTKEFARRLVLCSLLCGLPAAQLAHAQAPTVSSVTPTIGPSGGNRKVTIVGTNFQSGATVQFGTVSAASVTYVSATTLTAITPVHTAGEVTVSVTDSGGTGDLPKAYDFTNGPVLFTVSPSSGPPVGGNVVKLEGANLKPVTQVLFGSTAATIQSTSPGEVDVVAPSGAGRANVTVESVHGKYTVANGYSYTMRITTLGLDDSYEDLPYSNTLNAIGGTPPLTWSIVSGQLPTGLKLSASTGIVSGTPNNTINTYTVKFRVKDSSQPFESATATITFNNLYGFQPIPIPVEFFGMMVYDQTNPAAYPSVPVGYLGKGDATTWPFIEQNAPVNGVPTFNWTALDQYVALAQAHGLNFYWTNANIPPWAATDTTTCSYYEGTTYQACTSMVTSAHLPDFDVFLDALVQRYQGKITMYELWNEPNVPQVWTGSMTDMITLTTHVYNAVRANDPAALIGGPSSTDADWLQTFFQTGGPTGVDIIDIHGYPNVGLDDAPEAIVGFKTVNPKINMAQIGLQNKPIWDSENSWGGPDSDQDPDYRASFLARSLLLHWSAGIPISFWYEWDGLVWGTLWTPTNGITPAGTADGIVQGWMTGATMPAPCSMNGGTTFKAVYTCALTRSGGYQALAVWDSTRSCSGGVCTTSTYTPDSKYVQYRDIVTGDAVAISPGQTVQIGLKPILLENMNPPQ
jgi:polysaccharide biosynthesis protein PslG